MALGNLLTARSPKVVGGLVAAIWLLVIVAFWEHIKLSLTSRYYSAVPKGQVSQNVSSLASTNEGLSLKVLAYIFPQFHAFPENDQFWGVNFTEWTNVKPIKKNALGQEFIQPDISVGYYNLLDYETRVRQGKFIKKHNIHGVIYHHYWFGRPVMDGVLQKLLEDGEPSVPFMLSWANEQWTKTWMGTQKVDPGSVLIAQTYGTLKDWRTHFDWLLPFFLHPLYLRDHGRVLFAFHHMEDIGENAKPMIKAWKGWALEAGFELEIFQTIWATHQVSPWVDGLVNLAPHHSGSYDHDSQFYGRAKRHVIHNRGTLVCWDNTPRHAADGKAGMFPYCHPARFQQHLMKMFEYIKMTPNPPGHDNFFLINALNEWAEGNVLEASQLWHDRYADAVNNAIEYSAKHHKWLPDRSWTAATSEPSSNYARICYLIGVGPQDSNDDINNLQRLLRALQTQQNTNWHAVMFSPSESTIPNLKTLVEGNLDERLSVVEIDVSEVEKTYSMSALHKGADWIIKHHIITGKNTACGSADYLHITEGHNLYSETAFSWPANRTEDIIALSTDQNSAASRFYSRSSAGAAKSIKWDKMCVRLQILTTSICPPTLLLDNADHVDLSAFLIRISSWLPTRGKFSDLEPANPWKTLSKLMLQHQWRSANRESGKCDVLHDPSVGQCRHSAGIWLDSPVPGEAGCYTASQLRKLRREAVGETWQWDYLSDVQGEYDGRYDLQRFRKDPWCIRFTEEAYKKRLESLS